MGVNQRRRAPRNGCVRCFRGTGSLLPHGLAHGCLPGPQPCTPSWHPESTPRAARLQTPEKTAARSPMPPGIKKRAT
ncbi:Hypothetical protein AA314_03842 [Archangium gephyra]|uniref:Uncharacterized protein n=1 Tax=Archangium gephyra TaxID=48 RepID=A0AAC8Q7C4_9BACT|nr:Hypothetical protein AA314_03842 [Archangium gephyra]